MKLKFSILLILCFFFGTGLFAQEKWTMDECVAYALEHNLQLKDFKYTSDAGREDYRQSIRNLLPEINANTSYTINFGRSTDPFTNDVVTNEFFSNPFSVQSSIDLFQGFQKINSIKASKFLYRAAQEETLQQKFLLAFRVMKAFNNIQFFDGLVAIANEQLGVSRTNYQLVEKQIELGLMAGADLYEAKSALLADELNLTQSENQLASAKLTLIQEMNLEGASDIEIQTNISQMVPSIDCIRDALH